MVGGKFAAIAFCAGIVIPDTNDHLVADHSLVHKVKGKTVSHFADYHPCFFKSVGFRKHLPDGTAPV